MNAAQLLHFAVPAVTSDQVTSDQVMSDKVMSDELVTPHSSLVTAPASLRTAPAEFATVLEAALEWRGEQESGGAGDGGRKTEDGGPKTEGGPLSSVFCPLTPPLPFPRAFAPILVDATAEPLPEGSSAGLAEGGAEGAGDGSQRTEDGGRKTEDGSLSSVSCPLTPDSPPPLPPDPSLASWLGCQACFSAVVVPPPWSPTPTTTPATSAGRAGSEDGGQRTEDILPSAVFGLPSSVPASPDARRQTPSPIPQTPALPQRELPAAATSLLPTAAGLVPPLVAGLNMTLPAGTLAPLSSGTSLAVMEVLSDEPVTRHSSLVTILPTASQLPGAVAAPENVAQSAAPGPLAAVPPGAGAAAMPPAASKGLTGLPTSPAAGREPRGTSAAKSKENMKQIISPEQAGVGTDAGGRATDGDESALGVGRESAPLNFPSRTLDATEWPPGRSVGSSDRSAPEVSAARGPDTNRTVEQISGLLLREVGLLRQHSPDSMAVILRPDVNTELMVHLTQRNGQVEASVRCERGDFQQLGALWGQLQEALAGQKIQLAPLQESSGGQPDQRAGGPADQPGGRGAREQGREGAEEQAGWPADPQARRHPQTPDPKAQTPNLRPQTGWETWA